MPIHCSQLLDSLLRRLASAQFNGGLDYSNVFASIDLVVSLSRNYASHAATRIWVVAFSTRNEVNVAMHYRLTSSRAAIDPYVETQHGRVLL